MTLDLRHGRWEEALDGATCDALITDPPYGERCHKGQRAPRDRGARSDGWISSEGLGYSHWTPEHVSAFVESWSPRVRGWFVAFTSHDLIPAWEAAFEAAGRYVFAPLACVQRGMNVRLRGDGPSNWTTWLVVARPRSAEMASWGALPGAYTGPRRKRIGRSGGKPLWMMREIVRDYSRPGDVVCDPCAGGGTTLLAALLEGRQALGAEVDAQTFAYANARCVYRWEAP